MVLIWISEVVFSQGLVKSCLLSGRVGIVNCVSISLLMRSVVCCVLCFPVVSCFQSPPLDSPAMGEKEAECVCFPAST